MTQHSLSIQEFQQGKNIVNNLGLLSEFPPEICSLQKQVKEIFSSSKVVSGMAEGDHDSLVMFTLIYWGIVKNFPRTIIKNVKNFLSRFEDKNTKSSRGLLFLFNFTNRQRQSFLESMERGKSGIIKDYAMEECSHMDYWKEIMVHLELMETAKYGKLSPIGAQMLDTICKASPVVEIDRLVNQELQMRDALLAMLAVEFIAVGVSEAVVDSSATQGLLSQIPRKWFDVHYHAHDQHFDGADDSNLLELQLPHDTINYNMARLVHTVDHPEEDFQACLFDRVLSVASAFADAGNYEYEFNSYKLQQPELVVA